MALHSAVRSNWSFDTDAQRRSFASLLPAGRRSTPTLDSTKRLWATSLRKFLHRVTGKTSNS